MNRETWLNDLATKMAPRFEELGHKIPAFRVSIGFTSGGKGSNANGECWHARKSADGRYEVLITPDMAEPLPVAAVLAHELCHAAAGFKHKHKGEFATLMAQLGMQRPFTSSISGDAFAAWVRPFLEELGPLPHAPLMFRAASRAPVGANDNGADECAEDDDSSNQKKKQATRLLKAICGDCGYTVRITRKWVDEVGAPHCPMHGAMAVEDSKQAA